MNNSIALLLSIIGISISCEYHGYPLIVVVSSFAIAFVTWLIVAIIQALDRYQPSKVYQISLLDREDFQKVVESIKED